MKAFNLILACFFFIFAALQFNDSPDDIWYWVLIYASVGAISAFAAFGKYNIWVLILIAAAILYQLFRIGPAFLHWIHLGMPSIVGKMEASSPHIEYVREFIGLLLCLGVVIFHSVRAVKNIKEERAVQDV